MSLSGFVFVLVGAVMWRRGSTAWAWACASVGEKGWARTVVVEGLVLECCFVRVAGRGHLVVVVVVV